MTRRKEFSLAIRSAAIKRATRTVGSTTAVFCEACHSLAKTYEVDHVNPDGLTGQPTLENARVLCTPCHREKTKADVARIAKAKRREGKHLGAYRPKAKIKSPGFAPAPPPRRASKPIPKLDGLPHPSLFREA